MFEIMSETNVLQDKLHWNAEYFITKMTKLGFDIKPTKSAICAVMLYDARLSQHFASKLLKEGIYVIGFYYPVVPKEQARIRVQLSAAHEKEHLDKAIEAFEKTGKELGVLT
jgi:glycine C-acetyltransferase